MPGAFGGTLLKLAINQSAAGSSQSAAGPSSSFAADWDEDAALARRLQDEEETATYFGVVRDDDASLALAHKIHDEETAALSSRVGFDDGDSLTFAQRLQGEEAALTLPAAWEDGESLALARRLQAEDEAASLGTGWDEENLSLACRIHADEDATLRLQEEDRRRLQEEDDAALGQVTDRDRRAQERRLRQLTSQKRRVSWARALSRSRTSRKPGTSNAPSLPSHHNTKFTALGGFSEPSAPLSLHSHPSSSSSSAPLWQEAFSLVEMLHVSERYANRQQAAHQLASTLARLHGSAPMDALELLRHIESIGKAMDAPFVLTLLELAVEAEETQPTDNVTVQLVLSCLTNMSVGSGIEAILREGRAIQMIISWLVSANQRTREFSLACVYNLASTTDRRLAHFRAVLLDSLASPGVQPSLRRVARESTGRTAMHAQVMLNYKLERRAELARGAHSSKEGTIASPFVDLTVGCAKHFDQVNEPVSADATFVEADSTDEEADGAAVAAMGGLRLDGRMRRRNGGYNLVLAVIAPDWAVDVSCVAHPEEPIVSAIATLANPAHNTLTALATFTAGPSHSSGFILASSSRERLPRRQVSPPRRKLASICMGGQVEVPEAAAAEGEENAAARAAEEDSPLLGADAEPTVTNAGADGTAFATYGLRLSSAPLLALASDRPRYSSVRSG